MIGNICKPTKDKNSVNDINSFTAEFENIVSELKDLSAEVFIAGDLNINLLDVGTWQAYEDFFDSVLWNGFYPSITLPTRLGTNKCSLIENIYLKLSPLSKNAEAGILCSKISDHFPYFLGLKLNAWYQDKSTHLVKKHTNNEAAVSTLLVDLMSRDSFTIGLCSTCWSECEL